MKNRYSTPPKPPGSNYSHQQGRSNQRNSSNNNNNNNYTSNNYSNNNNYSNSNRQQSAPNLNLTQHIQQQQQSQFAPEQQEQHSGLPAQQMSSGAYNPNGDVPTPLPPPPPPTYSSAGAQETYSWTPSFSYPPPPLAQQDTPSSHQSAKPVHPVSQTTPTSGVIKNFDYEGIISTMGEKLKNQGVRNATERKQLLDQICKLSTDKLDLLKK